MSDLLVKHDDNGAFTDYSSIAKDYLRDTFTIDYTNSEDYIYIGLYKPFNTIYLEIETPDQGDLSATIEGNPIALDDDTQSFNRSGFMMWDKPAEWSTETINGVDAYWIRLESSTAIAPVFKGINIVFSDDADLLQENRNIMNLTAKGDISFIAYHVASRNEIIQTLRNGGFTKKVDDLVENITKWDILEVGEIRQASKYLTLAKIFFDISTNTDDKHYLRFRDYQGMYGKAFKTFYLKLDQNDDGVYDQETDLTDTSVEVLKV